MSASNLARGSLRYSLAAALLASCAPSALHAETSNTELAKEIAELKAQIRELKGAVSETRTESRRTSAKVREVAAHPYTLPPPSPAIPYGATPAFVTADNKLQFGALTITPGGFIEAASVFRSKNLQADIATPFNNVPFNNSILGNTNEFRPSARGSRAALLIEAPISPSMLVSGYGELDFIGAAPTGNENQTNSYTPRIRHLYSALDNSEYGLHVLAGQTWSLVTLNTKGITPRNELLPNVIDQQQNVGSLYARQAQIRFVKDFDKKLWLGLSIEESQTTGCAAPTINGSSLGPYGGTALANGVTAFCDYVGQGGAFVSNTSFGQAYSFDHLPDVIGKVAYEAKLADRDVHLEAFGIGTDVYDRVNVGGTVTSLQAGTVTGGTFSTKDRAGYGVGGGIVAPLIPKTLDFQVNGIYGQGINRYGPAGLNEATVQTDGSLHPLTGYVAMAGLTWHATPAIDVYGYAGIEGVNRYFTSNGAGFIGVGAPGINNSGCLIEGSANCTGGTSRIYEITGGFWDKLYKGSFGEVRAGLQYSFFDRQIYNSPGVGSGYGPSANDHMVMTSLRYYPFQANPAAPPPVVAKY